MAKECELLADIVAKLADCTQPMRAHQVYEYCALMARIGRAIADQNEVELKTAVEELDKKPFILS